MNKIIKRLIFISITVFIILLIGLFWLYGRIVPGEAAMINCRIPMAGYKCLNISGFNLSVYQSDNKNKKSNIPVLILHGGPGFSSSQLYDYFTFLEKDYPVYMYDQRGSGYSEIKPDLKHYDYNKIVDEVEDVRKQTIKSDKMIVIGHSFGGYLALSYALKYSSRVEKLVLISAPVPQKNLSQIFSLLSQGIPPADQLAANKWLTNILGVYFSDTFYSQKTLKQFIPGAASYAAMITISNSLFDTPIILEQLNTIKQPVLLMYGVKETLTTGENQQKQLHKQLPNSTLVKMNQSGHWAFMEEQENFKQIINKFLSRNSKNKNASIKKSGDN